MCDVNFLAHLVIYERLTSAERHILSLRVLRVTVCGDGPCVRWSFLTLCDRHPRSHRSALQTLKLTHKLLLCSSLLDINYVNAVSYNMNTPEASRQQGGTGDRATALRDPSTPRQAAGP